MRRQWGMQPHPPAAVGNIPHFIFNAGFDGAAAHPLKSGKQVSILQKFSTRNQFTGKCFLPDVIDDCIRTYGIRANLFTTSAIEAIPDFRQAKESVKKPQHSHSDDLSRLQFTGCDVHRAFQIA